MPWPILPLVGCRQGARRGSATDFHGKSLDPDDDIIQLGMKNDQEGLWPVIFLPHFDAPGNGDA